MVLPVAGAWSTWAAVGAVVWHKRQANGDSTGDKTVVEPRQITLMPVVIGCGLDLLLFGMVLGAGGALLNVVAAMATTTKKTTSTSSSRRASSLVAVALSFSFGGLRLGFDVHAAQRIWYNSETVFSSFAEDDGTYTTEEPVGIRTLCALTACMALPFLARQIVYMVKRASVPAAATLFATLSMLAAIGTGLVASVLRSGKSDPGWAATNDRSLRQPLQLTMYTGLTVACTFIVLETCTASLQAKKLQHDGDLAVPKQQKNGTILDIRARLHTNALAAAVTGFVSFVLLLTSLLCSDLSMPLIGLMPLGNAFVLVYLVDTYFETTHQFVTLTPSTPTLQNKMLAKNFSSSQVAGKLRDESVGHDTSCSSSIDFEQLQSISSSPSSSLSSHSYVSMPIHHDELAATLTAPSVRKMNVDYGTPTFLRYDPYAVASSSTSLSSSSSSSLFPSQMSSSPSGKISPTSSLQRPARVRARNSNVGTTERSPLVSSPLSRSVSTFQIDDDEEEEKKEDFRRSQQALVLMQRALVLKEQSNAVRTFSTDDLKENDGAYASLLPMLGLHEANCSNKDTLVAVAPKSFQTF